MLPENNLGSAESNDKREQTLGVLKLYIERQRGILERAQADIQKLNELKCVARENPGKVLDSIIATRPPNENTPHSSLGDLFEAVRGDGCSEVLGNIEWNLYRGTDPSSLLNLATSCRHMHPSSVLPPILPNNNPAHSNIPFSHLPPQPALSELQRLVRHYKALIIDPALKQAAEFVATLPSDTDYECDEPKNKKRKLGCGLTIRVRGPGGVFIRKGCDESADVDISSPNTPRAPPARRKVPVLPSSTPLSSSAGAVSPVPCEPLAKTKQARTRRPSMKLRERALDASSNANEGQSNGRSTTPSTCNGNKPIIKLKLRIPPRPPPLFPPRSRSPITKSAFADSPSTATNTHTSFGTSSRSASARTSTPTPTHTTAEQHSDIEPEDVEAHDPENDTLKDENEPPLPKRARRESVQEQQPIIHFHQEYEQESPRPRPLDLNDYGYEQSQAQTQTRPVSNGKKRSETYKVQWSLSEQHLLDKLLQDIPDGEKNRWAKISAAMGGRRTARQVASRVQKYFLKLKQFGVDLQST